MAGNGLNLGVGIDLSQFDKDISYVNKKLRTVGGQVELATIKFKDSDNPLVKQIQEAQKMYEKAFDGMSRVLYEKIGKNGKLEIFDINNVKEAEEAVAYLKKQLAKVEKSNNPNKDKLVSSYTQQIADVNQYIIAVGKLSDAFTKAGLASMPKGDRERLAERNAISEEIKLLQQKQALNQQNTQISDYTKLNEEIRLQKELISLLEKKQSTYKNGYNKNVATQINAARNELEVLRQQAKQISENNRLRNSEASAIDKINNLEKKRAATKGLNSKIARYQQERIIVSRLVTQWERYLAIATKLNNTTGVANANAKLDALRKEEIALRNLEKAERDRIRAVNQNKSLLNEQEGLFNKLKTAASNYLSIYQLFRVGKELIEATKYFEQQRVALEGIVGSAAEATKAIDQLKQMSLESPKTLKELVGYTKQLSAYGIAVEELLPTTKKLADLSSGLGVDMSRLILAYGQVNAASVLRGQELRQFTEAGIPLVEKLAEKFTALNGKLVTTGEVFELISKRQVSFQMVSDVLSDMTAEGGEFYKMQEKLTDTLYGQIEKLKDVWTIQLNEVGSKLNGFIRGVVESLQKVIHNIPLLLSAISFAGLIKTATALPALFKKVGNSIHAINIQMRWFERGLNRTVGAGNKLAFVFKNMLASLKSNLVVAAISLIGGAIINAAAKTREWKKELEEIDRSFAKDTAKYTVGFEKLISKLAMATEGTKEYNDAIKTLKSNYGDYVSDALINQLIEERRQLQDTAQGWGMLHDSIVAAIEAKKEYERHETRKNTAAEGLTEDFNVNKVVRGLRHYVRNLRESVNDGGHQSAYEEYNEIYSALKNDDIKTALRDALADFTEAGETSIDDFERRLIRKLKMQSIDTKTSDYIIEKIGYIFGRVTKSKKWETYLKELGILENDPYELIKKEFSNAKNIVFNSQEGRWADGMKNTDYNPFQLSVVEDQQAAIAAKNLIDNFFKNLSDEDINNQSGFKKAKDAITNAFGDLSLKAFQADAGKTKTIADALNSLFTTINKPDLRAQLSAITNAFLEMAGTKTGRAKSISSAIMADYGVGSNADKAIKDFMAYYLPNDENIDELRDAIAKEISSLRSKIKDYGSTQENEGNWEYVEWMQAELKKYETLASDKYYDITEEEIDAAGKKELYTRIRTTNFFDEFLSLIKKAEDATKKIVGVTGYTSALGDFVGSLSDKNFLRAFFEQGGNPFADMVKEMTEKYGIEDFIPEFNVDDLKTIFKELSVNGETILVPDYEAIYKKVTEVVGNQVIEGLRKERDKYQEGTRKYNSIDSEISIFQEHQAKAVKEMEERWGIDEIANKIDAEIRALQEINSTLKTQDDKRKLFEDMSAAMGYRAAQKLVYGEDSKYERYNPAKVTQDNLRRLLNETIAGKGVAETEPGKLLKSLLAGSSVGLGSLSQLIDIKKALQEEVNKEFLRADLEGTVEAKERAKQFQDVVGMFTKGIDEVAEETGDAALKIIKASQTLDMEVSVKLGNLEREYKDSIAILDELAETNPTIAEEKDRRILELTQDYFNNVLTALGGEAMPDWLKQMFGGSDKTGFNEFGKFLNSMSGNLSLEDMIKQGIADKFAKGEAAGGASDATGTIALVDAIIKAIYDVLSFATKLGTQIIDWMEKTNDVTKTVVKKADGSTNTIRSAKDFDYTNDMYATYTEKYDSDKLARQKASLQAVQTFNQHIMDGWENLKSGNVLGAVFETIASIGDLVVDIFGISDSAREQTIQGLLQDVQNLNKSLETIDFRTTFMSGWQAADELSKKITVLLEQQEAYEAAWDEENAKKSSDQEKLDEYQAGASEAFRAQLEQIKALRDEIMGTADALAGNLTNALVSAFKNGENAARAWKDAVKNYIGEVLTQVVFTKMIAPKIQDALNEWMYGFTDSYGKNGNLITAEQKALERYGENYDEVAKQRLKDEKLAKEANASLDKIGTTAIDIYEHLPEGIKDYISYNGAGSSFAGGISGITEDTARQLEGLGNSQLMQLIVINRTLSQYLDNMDNYSQSQYMANVQTHLVSIDGNVSAILSLLRDMRAPNGLAMKVSME